MPIFSWFTRRRRRKLRAAPFSEQWLGYLSENAVVYRLLSEADQAKLRDRVKIFMAEKYWEGSRGLNVTDEMKLTVGAQACVLVLGFDEYYYERLRTIVLYPEGYSASVEGADQAGLIREGSEEREGEAWHRGPVVLSWKDALAGGRDPCDGVNLVYHEFAHQLDMLDGDADGTPPLADEREEQRWRAVMAAEYKKLVKDADRGRATLLDDYGATNPAEFFAVATECFFERPVDMAARHGQLYEVLRSFYRQDPALWPGMTGQRKRP